MNQAHRNPRAVPEQEADNRKLWEGFALNTLSFLAFTLLKEAFSQAWAAVWLVLQPFSIIVMIGLCIVLLSVFIDALSDETGNESRNEATSQSQSQSQGPQDPQGPLEPRSEATSQPQDSTESPQDYPVSPVQEKKRKHSSGSDTQSPFSHDYIRQRKKKGRRSLFDELDRVKPSVPGLRAPRCRLSFNGQGSVNSSSESSSEGHRRVVSMFEPDVKENSDAAEDPEGHSDINLPAPSVGDDGCGSDIGAGEISFTESERSLNVE